MLHLQKNLTILQKWQGVLECPERMNNCPKNNTVKIQILLSLVHNFITGVHAAQNQKLRGQHHTCTMEVGKDTGWVQGSNN